MIRTLREFINLFKEKKKKIHYNEVLLDKQNYFEEDTFYVTSTYEFDSDNNCAKQALTESSSTAITYNVEFESYEGNQFLTKRFLERQ